MSIDAQHLERSARGRTIRLASALGGTLCLGLVIYGASIWSTHGLVSNLSPDYRLLDPSLAGFTPQNPAPAKDDPPGEAGRSLAPELDGGVAWLNTAGPVRIRDLR